MSGVRSIYLIDDDLDESIFFKEALDEICPGCNLKSYNSANEFLSSTNNESVEPDLYFLDINMPGLHGVKALKFMREDMKLKAPIIMYTNGRNERQIEDCQELGANLYFVKPVNFDVLKHKINDILSFDWPTMMKKDTHAFVVGF